MHVVTGRAGRAGGEDDGRLAAADAGRRKTEASDQETSTLPPAVLVSRSSHASSLHSPNSTRPQRWPV